MIYRSLDTWQLLWNTRSDIFDIEAIEQESNIDLSKRVGFFQHGEEYRLFALAILQSFRKQPQSRARLVQPFPKQDENSMDQVAGFLSTVQFS